MIVLKYDNIKTYDNKIIYDDMIILKVTKKNGFHPLFKRYIFQKTTGGGGIPLLAF